MPDLTPVYQIPYAAPTDPVRDYPLTARDAALRIDAALAESGHPPIDGDLASILARLTAVERQTNPGVVLAGRTATQTWVASQWQWVQWQGASVVGSGCTMPTTGSNADITITEAGIYAVSAQFTITGSNELAVKWSRTPNGASSAVDTIVYQGGNSSGWNTQTAAGVLSLGAGDRIAVQARQTAPLVADYPAQCSLSVYQIRRLP